MRGNDETREPETRYRKWKLGELEAEFDIPAVGFIRTGRTWTTDFPGTSMLRVFLGAFCQCVPNAKSAWSLWARCRLMLVISTARLSNGSP